MRNFVLVAGVNYRELRLNKSFLYAVNKRVDYLIGLHGKDDKLNFTIFDATTGKAWDVVVDEKGRHDPNFRPLPRKQVTKANYEIVKGRLQLRDRQDKVMSITDVYKRVKEIGQKEPGTLYELSFFAHSWLGGPIIANSIDDRKYMDPTGETENVFEVTNGGRDPDDKDGRAHIDFASTNEMLKLFRLAFNSDGVVRNWGCLHTKYVVEAFERMFKHSAYRASGLPDDTRIQLKFSKEIAKELSKEDSNLQPPVNGQIWEGTFYDFRRFMFFELIGSFTSRAAQEIGVHSFGGVPGAESTFGSDGTTAMMIEMKGRTDQMIASFYEEYLKVNFEPNSNYAIFPMTGPEAGITH